MDKYLPPKDPPGLGELLDRARDALTPPPGAPPPAPPRGPGITAWYLIGGIVAGQYDVRTMDYATRFSHRITVTDRPTLAFPELMVPVRPVIQNLAGEPIEIVFSPIAQYGDGIRIPGHTQWTPEAITAIPIVGGGTDVAVIQPTRVNVGPWGAVLVTGDVFDPLPVIPGGGTFGVDVTDEAGRLLGIVASITAPVDVSDRAARLLGVATIAHGKTLAHASVSLAATGNVVAGVGGSRIFVYAYKWVVDAAIAVSWRDGGAGVLEGAQAFAANGGAAESVMPPAYLFATSVANGLDLVIGGAGNVRGRVSYWIE